MARELAHICFGQSRAAQSRGVQASGIVSLILSPRNSSSGERSTMTPLSKGRESEYNVIGTSLGYLIADVPIILAYNPG